MSKVVKAVLKFGPSSSPDVTGYKLYIEEAPNPVTEQSKSIDLGNSTEIDMSTLPGIDIYDGTYNLAITAVDDAGNESDMRTLDNVAIDFFAPAAPGDPEIIRS